MAAKKEVSFVIRARDATRGVFRRIRRGIGNLRVGVTGLLGAVGLGAVIRNLTNFATSLEAASSRLNISAETLQGLRLQAERYNIPFESLVTLLQRLQTNGGRALQGQQDLADAFAAFGISVDDLNRLDADSLFFRLADGVRQAGTASRTARANLARIVDTEGVRAIALLAEGSARLRQENERLYSSGAIRSAERLAEIAEAEAAAREESARAARLATEVLAESLPALVASIERLVELLDSANRLGAAIGQNAPTPIDILNRANQLQGPITRFSDALTPDVVQRGLRALERTAENTEDFGALS